MKPEWFSQWVSPVEKVASRYLARLEVPSRGQWVSAPPEKLDSLQADRLWQMYHLSYGNIGMHVPSLQALLADHDLLWVTDIDGDGEFDAFIAYKKSPAGNKLALMGSDGSSASKRATITKCVELLKSPGWYAELSHRPAQLMEQAGVSKIDDEELVRNTLRKPLEWLGDGQYVRTIGSLGAVTKSLYGHPRGASSHNRTLVKLAKEPSYQKKKKVKKQDGGEMTVYELNGLVETNA